MCHLLFCAFISSPSVCSACACSAQDTAFPGLLRECLPEAGYCYRVPDISISNYTHSVAKCSANERLLYFESLREMLLLRVSNFSRVITDPPFSRSHFWTSLRLQLSGMSVVEARWETSVGTDSSWVWDAALQTLRSPPFAVASGTMVACAGLNILTLSDATATRVTQLSSINCSEEALVTICKSGRKLICG